MATDNTNFIPTIWSGALRAHLDSRLVALSLCNNSYEGEIRGAGATVKVNRLGNVSIFDVDKDTDIPAAERLTSDQLEMVIDQRKGFNFGVDAADIAQANVDLPALATARAGVNVSQEVDANVLGYILSNVDAGNDIGPVTLAGPEAAYELLVDLAVRLDTENVPEMDRFAVVHPSFYGLLLKDDRFIRATAATTATNALNAGMVGEAAGLTIFKTTGVDSDVVLAGHRMATSVAFQINGIEFYSPQARIGEVAVKGQVLFGRKVFEPKGLATATWSLD